jgi:hypothetical protein
MISLNQLRRVFGDAEGCYQGFENESGGQGHQDEEDWG